MVSDRKTDLVELYSRPGAAAAFESEIIRRATGQVVKITRDYFFHMNPLFEPRLSLRYVLGRYEPAFDALRRLKPRRVLEVGGAQGLSTWFMTSYADEVIGLDVLEDRVAVGRVLFPEVHWITADWREHLASVPDGTYDVVVCSYGPVVWDNLTRDKCRLCINVGYRTRDWTVAISGSHKLAGRQLAFSTTLAGDGLTGRDPSYLKYFFRRNWLKEAKHALVAGYALPI